MQNNELTPHDVAQWLASECTDEEFAETFVLMNLMISGKHNGEKSIENAAALLGEEQISELIRNILREIKDMYFLCKNNSQM